MPWKVGAHVKGKGWPIVRADTGEVVGYSDSAEKAAASVRARYANTSPDDRLRSAMKRRAS